MISKVRERMWKLISQERTTGRNRVPPKRVRVYAKILLDNASGMQVNYEMRHGPAFIYVKQLEIISWLETGHLPPRMSPEAQRVMYETELAFGEPEEECDIPF